jgi:hypothetical protein
MAQIIVNANIAVPNGPTLAFNQIIDVDAYDKIDVAVPAQPSGTSEKEVELVAGTGVLFIAIIADAYSEDLTYKINNSSATARKLDQPHVFIGKGGVSIFDPAPASLFFSNPTTGTDANVQILIGRDATP